MTPTEKEILFLYALAERAYSLRDRTVAQLIHPAQRTSAGPLPGVPFDDETIMYQCRNAGMEQFGFWLRHWRPDLGDWWDAAVVSGALAVS